MDVGWQDGVAQDGKLVGDIKFPQLASGDVDLDDLVGCECIGLGLGVRRWLRWIFHERRTYILPSRPVVMSHGEPSVVLKG